MVVQVPGPAERDAGQGPDGSGVPASEDGAENGLDRSNTIRAGVFGIQDGVVSNFGLIMGVAGANISPGAVVVAGIAGVVSGAVSMGAGEYVSVRTQAEMLAAQRVVEAHNNVSPYRAAAANAALFATGGAFPLLPFIFTTGINAVLISIVLCCAVLFGAGAVLTRLTRRPALVSGMRLLVIGGGAGLLGYLVGTLLGGAIEV